MAVSLSSILGSDFIGDTGYTGSRGSLGYTGSSGVLDTSEVVFTGSIKEQTYQITDNETIIIEPGNGSMQFLIALDATPARTIDVSNFLDGETVALMINDNSETGDVITSWSTVEWVNNGGVAPFWPDNGNYTVVSLWKINGTVYGALVGDGN